MLTTGQPRDVQETTLQAYAALEPSLAQRQQAVLVALDAYHRAWRTWPTARELLRFMVDRDPSVGDINSVRPRLTELDDTGAVLKIGKRPCSVTGKTVYTWRPADRRLF